MRRSTSSSTGLSSASAIAASIRGGHLILDLERAAELLMLTLQALAPAQPVDGAAPCDSHEPRSRFVRNARHGPLLERNDQGVLCKLLRQPDVVHHPRKTADDPADSILQTASIVRCVSGAAMFTNVVKNHAVRNNSAFYRARRHARNEVALCNQVQDQDGDRPQHAHRHHFIPFVGVLPHQELDPDRHGAHVRCLGKRQGEEELIPRQQERIDAVATIPGTEMGTSTRQRAKKLEPPSIITASSISRGSVLK